MAQINKSKGIAGLVSGLLLAAASITYFNTNQHVDLKSHKVQGLVEHCAATPEGRNTSAKTVDGYHTWAKPRGRGERISPYNVIIELDGTPVWFRTWDTNSVVDRHEVSWGSAEWNICCFNVCYIGGCDKNMKPKNTLTAAQDSTLKNIVFDFVKTFPNAYVIGHNQLVNKACPSFDTRQKCLDWGVPVNNIWKLNSKYKIPEKYGEIIFKAG